ncbi:MAG: PEP/pyruvate-binding domain-containing protein, partial [Planctomycetota bacterium]
DDGIADYVSIVQPGGHLATPIGRHIPEPVDRLCITFDLLLRKGGFPDRIHAILRTLEDAYHVPVDIEFTLTDGRLHILQCRPLGGMEDSARLSVPTDIPAADRIFSAHRWVSTAHVKDIDYLVLIDPKDYGELESVDARIEVGLLVSRLNELLADKTFLLMGPGRWGTQDLRLGIRVSFGDICNAKALIEIARKAEGLTPEPSFGTHFFQELVEASIQYLPLYPDERGELFNEPFLRRSPNSLTALLGPETADLEGVVRVLDIRALAPGRHLELVMDGEAQEALCYLR